MSMVANAVRADLPEGRVFRTPRKSSFEQPYDPSDEDQQGTYQVSRSFNTKNQPHTFVQGL
jgi:hypothetical protein